MMTLLVQAYCICSDFGFELFRILILEAEERDREGGRSKKKNKNEYSQLNVT
jgi:hypothetical protein